MRVMHPSYTDPEDPHYLDPEEEPGPGGWSCSKCLELNLACRRCALSRSAALERDLMAEGGEERLVERKEFLLGQARVSCTAAGRGSSASLASSPCSQAAQAERSCR